MNPTAFFSGLSDRGLEGQTGEFGSVIVVTPEDVRYALRFHNFANEGQAENLFVAPTVSFTFQASDPALHTLTTLVTYSGKETQTLHPSIHDIAGITALLDKMGLPYQIRTTGSLDLLDENGATIWRGMPDLTLRPPDADQDAIMAAGDVDGNGKMDFEFKTPVASQYIYAVPY